jgi:hypothetical protein
MSLEQKSVCHFLRFSRAGDRTRDIHLFSAALPVSYSGSANAKVFKVLTEKSETIFFSKKVSLIFYE